MQGLSSTVFNAVFQCYLKTIVAEALQGDVDDEEGEEEELIASRSKADLLVAAST